MMSYNYMMSYIYTAGPKFETTLEICVTMQLFIYCGIESKTNFATSKIVDE